MRVTPPAGGSGVEAFTDLSDVPAAYSGHGGKMVVVKDDESGLEFLPVSGGGGDFLSESLEPVPQPGTLTLALTETAISAP